MVGGSNPSGRTNELAFLLPAPPLKQEVPNSMVIAIEFLRGAPPLLDLRSRAEKNLRPLGTSANGSEGVDVHV